MGSKTQTDEKPLIMYTVADLRYRLKSTEIHALLYGLLNFGCYPLFSEDEVCVQIHTLDDHCAYVELIHQETNQILEWRYIERMPYYLNTSC